MLKLRADPQQNPFPFVNKPFELDVYLVDEQDHVKSGEEIKLSITVSLHDETPVANQSRVIEYVENLGIQRNGAARVVAKFLDVSASFEKKRFVLNFHATHSVFRIASTQSAPYYCVRYKLHVDEENKSPYIWYKDEGGKDKCIEYRVSLRDSNNRIFRDRKVPLKVTLNYVSGTVVPHQNILVLSPDSRLIIDEQGDGLLKVRINEVSNRHRGQLFQVEISADMVALPGAADVAPIFCMPVDVKSKRNKGAPGKTSRDDGPISSSSSLHMPISYEPVKKQRITGASAYGPAFAQPSAAASSFAIGTSAKRTNPIPSHSTSYASNIGLGSSSAIIDEAKISASYTNSMNIGDAVNNIVNWTVRIMNGIDTIQWRELGYEQHPDGRPNMSRPLFSIPNPNAVLHSISEHYRLSVMSSLEYLQQVAELERNRRGANGGGADGREDGAGGTPIDSDEEGDGYTMAAFNQQLSRGRSGGAEMNLPILDRGFSSLSSQSMLEIPSINRNNSLFLPDGVASLTENSQSVLPMPALIPSLSSAWGVSTSVFDVS
jgi:hypothetical protein